tara:strand:+ start:32 stop:658 length:627 start_codon:yes stop_codon:yes gene_type:complete
MEQVLEDFYTEDEIDRIWKEIKYLDSNTYGWIYANRNSNAVVNDELLLQGARQFKFSVLGYNNLELLGKSNIYTTSKKIKQYSEYLRNKHDVYNTIGELSCHFCFLNYYYKDDGCYKLHQDTSMYTMLSFFYEEPRNFTGGDCIVGDNKYEIHNGFTIILPGWLKHGSTPIKIIDKDRKQSGRYCVANFFWSLDPLTQERDKPNVRFQ